MLQGAITNPIVPKGHNSVQNLQFPLQMKPISHLNIIGGFKFRTLASTLMGYSSLLLTLGNCWKNTERAKKAL